MDAEPLEGHPVKVNGTGHLIPVTEDNIGHYDDDTAHHDLPIPVLSSSESATRKKAIICMTFITVRKEAGEEYFKS